MKTVSGLGIKLLKNIIPILCWPISALMGFSTFYLLGTMLFTASNAGLPTKDTFVFTRSLFLLLLILAVLVVSCIWLFRKMRNPLYYVNILFYMAFIFMAPWILNNYERIRSMPPVKEQKVLQQYYAEKINALELPYHLDIDQSSSKTKESGRLFVVLTKTIEGDIALSEFQSIVNITPSQGIRLTLYNKEKDMVIGLAVAGDKSIKDCSPYLLCKKYNVDYPKGEWNL
jgi:hypothetical protein